MSELPLNPPVFRVRLLGPPGIEGPDGVLLGSVTQRHRIALLALLASSPDRLISRERLIGLLWPESGSSSARNLLSGAVHALRKALGDTVLVAEGDAVRLDPDRVRIDLLEFHGAVARGAAEQAVELYRGPFLEGLALRDAIEFEQWQELERERIERVYHAQLEQIARQAADSSAAVHWWRRRLECTPSEGRVVVELMRALERAGDRAGALQVAHAHASLLAREFDAAPDAEVNQLAEQLRRRPDVVAASHVPERASTARVEMVDVFAAQSEGRSKNVRLRLSRTRVVAGLSGVALIVIVFLVTQWAFQTAPLSPVARRQLTFTGDISRATISPDGQIAAYIAQAGDSQIVVMHSVSGGAPDTIYRVYNRLITMDWSADGSRLLLGAAGLGWGVVLPRTGGKAHVIKPAARICVARSAWLRDGRISRHCALDERIIILNLETEDTVAIPLRGSYSWLHEGSWSPSADVFALATRTNDPVQFAIQTVSLDGLMRPIVEDSVILSSPRWSSDGTTIYYIRGYDALWRIAVSPATGVARGKPKLVQEQLEMTPARGVARGQVSMSTDGRRFVWARGRRYSNLFLVERAERSQAVTRQLTTGTALLWSPVVSPDGRWIAFAQQSHGASELFKLPVNGGAPAQVTSGARVWPESRIAWSPDGASIAFQSVRGGKGRVWVARVSDGQLKRFDETRPSLASTGDLTWAPGSHIAYQAADNRNIQLLDENTSVERSLVPPPRTYEFLFSPRYSPDGKQLAVEWNRGTEGGMYVFDLDRSANRKVKLGSGWPSAWSHDGRYILGSFGTGSPNFYRVDLHSLVMPVEKPETWLNVPFKEVDCAPITVGQLNRFVCAVFDYPSDAWMMEATGKSAIR